MYLPSRSPFSGANISCLLLSLANFISLQTCIGPAFNQLCARSSNFLSRNAFTLLTILLGFFITLKIHPRRLPLAFVMGEAEDEVEGWSFSKPRTNDSCVNRHSLATFSAHFFLNSSSTDLRYSFRTCFFVSMCAWSWASICLECTRPFSLQGNMSSFGLIFSPIAPRLLVLCPNGCNSLREVSFCFLCRSSSLNVWNLPSPAL